MKEILKLIITNLVKNQEAVEITEKIEDNLVVFKVKVAESDMGAVIGKQGKIAEATRAILKPMAYRENKKVLVEYVD